jgi:hypothetical protein
MPASNGLFSMMALGIQEIEKTGPLKEFVLLLVEKKMVESQVICLFVVSQLVISEKGDEKKYSLEY